MDVIIEYREGELRAGFAGNARPSFTADSSFEVQKGLEATCLAITKELYDIFYMKLLVKPRECRVIVVEPLLCPKVIRAAFMQVLLKTFAVKAVSFQADIHMAIVASGVSSGVVVHVGNSESTALAFSGYRPIIRSLQLSPLGYTQTVESFGRALAKAWATNRIPPSHVHSLISQYAIGTMDAGADEDEVIVAALSNVETSPTGGPGSLILTRHLRTFPVEVLAYGAAHRADDVKGDSEDTAEKCDEFGGLAGLVLASLMKCEVDVRAKAARKLVLCGPGAALPHLSVAIAEAALQRARESLSGVTRERVLRDAHEAARQGHANDEAQLPPADLAWIGASLFACMPQSSVRFVTKADVYVCSSSSPADYTHAIPDWLAADKSLWTFQGQ